MSAMQDVLTAVRTTLATVTGIARVYDDPPEQVNEWPAAIVYVKSGQWRTITSSGGVNGWPMIGGLQTVVVSVAVPRKNLASDIARLQAFNDSVPVAIVGAAFVDRLDGTITGMGDQFRQGSAAPVRQELVSDDWAVGTIANRFEFDVTVNQEVTYANPNG